MKTLRIPFKCCKCGHEKVLKITIDTDDIKKVSPMRETMTEPAKEVLLYLNAKSGHRFEPTTTTLRLIISKFEDGYSVDDCKSVIDDRVYEWKIKPEKNGDKSEMSEYLRPSTLFRLSNFENYLGIALSRKELITERSKQKARSVLDELKEKISRKETEDAEYNEQETIPVP